jgi:hypothetical protein
LALEAKGDDIDLLFLDGAGSAQRARDHAKENLLQKSRNCMLPIPCPNCGFYQAEMAKRLKEEVSVNPFQVTGAAVTVVAFLLLFFGTAYAFVLAAVLAVAGLSLLCYGYVVEFRFDPNEKDAELRKAIGQRSAVWGDRLTEMLRTGEIAEPAPAPAADSG